MRLTFHITRIYMKIVSTMGSGDLDRELALDSVLQSLEEEYNIESNQHSVSMVTIRLESEGPALTLYRTGAYQIRGSETREGLFEANERLLDALRSIGVKLGEHSFGQKNAVYLEDLEMEIPLEALAVQLGFDNIEYEPEQFPGLIYRPPEIDAVNLIFATGKIIISGTIYNEIAEESVEHLQEQLARFSPKTGKQ